ncbi:MAG: DUF4398 domain-containing protein [Treponema sp.]|nr:DUF4398 domain-containing protein [Treponema sp.]
MRKFIITLLVVFFLGLVACAAPPVEDMQKAQDAVMQAESDADAVAYAGNSIIRARDALTRMQDEAEAKRYDAAKNYAAEAISYAEQAIADGRAGASRAMDEAANLINSLAGPLTETAGALNTARSVEGIQLDFDSLASDLSSAQSTYDEAWQSFNADNYRDAIDKGQAIRSMLADINARITDAAIVTSRKQ